MIGAHLLREHYRLSAQPVSGAASFCLSDELNPLAFAVYKDGRISAGLEGFHSWIECKGYVIDFLAPYFRENVAELDEHADLPRRVFMKPLSSMADRLPTKGDTVGTFHLVPDEVCQANMIRTFYERPVLGDLQTICSAWYRRPPKKMESTFLIRDDRGEVIELRRKDIGVNGFW